jgi:anion-transporting  ArsA/GET3 family ATPase
MADRLLGSQFLQDIAEFFLLFQSMYQGFVERANAVERLLRDRRTTFAVVTTLESAPLHEAEFFCEELTKRDYHLGALILNRTLPRYLLSPEGDRAAETMCADAAAIGDALVDTGSPALDDPARTSRVLTTIGESFQNFAVVAKREAELRAELAQAPDVLADVPALDSDVGDMGGLAKIAEALFAGS